MPSLFRRAILLAITAVTLIPFGQLQTAYAATASTPQFGKPSSVGLIASFQPGHDFNANVAESRQIATRSDWIVCLEKRCSQSTRQQMKQANPNLNIAAYEAISGAQSDEGATYSSCYARTTNNKRLLSRYFPGVVLMNPGCTAWKNYLVQTCQRLLSEKFDRCYYDVLNRADYYSLFYEEGDATQRPASPKGTLAEWQQAKKVVLQSAVAATAKKLWVNCYSHGDVYFSPETAIAGCNDTSLIEWSQAETFGRSTGESYFKDIQMITQAPVPVMMTCKMMNGYLDRVQELRCYSAHLMYGDNDMMQVTIKDQDATNVLSTAPENVKKLGRPLGAAVHSGPNGELAVRTFECGKVVINETSAKQSYLLAAGSYKTLNDASFNYSSNTYVVMNPWNANAFIKQGCTPSTR